MNKKSILAISCCIFFTSFTMVYGQDGDTWKINTKYALDYLYKATDLYHSDNFADSLACVRVGRSYDSSFADFAYLEARCLLQLHEPNGTVVSALEESLTTGLRWQIFTFEDAHLLLARLYAETKRYDDALSLLNSLDFKSADSDFYRAVSLYGLKHFEEARTLIAEAVDRWSFDSRFPILFFIQERHHPVSSDGKTLADRLMQRLYVWTEHSPAVLVYACPFEVSPKENTHRLKVFRNMYQSSQGGFDTWTAGEAILAELRYGVIDELTAVEEFFALRQNGKEPLLRDKTGSIVLYAEQLTELCSLAGTELARTKIADQLRSFAGAVLEDDNTDGILNSAVFFEHGRPVSALFDPNQDGIADYRITCSFGTPDTVQYSKNPYTVTYDTYPAVKSVYMQRTDKLYTMRPLVLRWNPVEHVHLDLGLEHHGLLETPFFTLALKSTVTPLYENELIFSALYVDTPDESISGHILRTHLEKGVVLSTELKDGSRCVASTQYRSGIPAQKKIDYDGDGFFEVLEEYSKQGKLQKISVDGNENRLFEYSEVYGEDGSITKYWDEDEDRVSDIKHIEYPSGEARTVWKEKRTGSLVAIGYKAGQPMSLTVGGQHYPLIKEDELPVYWLTERPTFAAQAAKELLKVFKEPEAEISSYIAEIGKFEVFAVWSGGALFVQTYPTPDVEAVQE